MTETHRLNGLEPDNLLAFLALLGTLRAIEARRPDWRPRAHWDIDVAPTRPVLTLSEPATAGEVSEMVAHGCDALAQDYDFGEWKAPNMPQKDARHLLLQAGPGAGPEKRGRADVLAALMSDGATKDDGSVIPTPLCLMFGQGHQHFLLRLASIPRQPAAPVRGRNHMARTPAETIDAAIFCAWERIDATDGFRWDPAEDRRYALRYGNPSDDAMLTVHGANRLAAIGFPVLTVVPATVRGRVRLLALGVRQERGETHAIWPIWIRPASLSGIRALLTHPIVNNPRTGLEQRSRLQALGIVEWRRAARVSVGKFLNFERAVSVW